MPDDVLTIRVECHAGHRGEEGPRRFWIGDRPVTASEIFDRWLAPDHRQLLRGTAGKGPS